MYDDGRMLFFFLPGLAEAQAGLQGCDWSVSVGGRAVKDISTSETVSVFALFKYLSVPAV